MSAGLEPKAHPGHSYRPDIDGLRAIAVVSVVSFHSGVPFVEGGFVGVDIFFVISGYLISGILMREIEKGTFTYRNFYDRRVRRILPALFGMLIVTSLMSAVLLIPSAFKAYGASVLATVFSASNFYFWTQADYFGIAAAQMPLLHTWSLAIEEQFYIFLPPYLYLMKRAFGPRWLLILSPLAVCSFVLCLWATERSRSAAFYFPISRMWELALGGLFAAAPRLSGRFAERTWREALAAFGLLLVFGSIASFTERTTFPGANALWPCLGTGLIIYANGAGRTLTGALLSVPPLTFLGLISYSLYLWHWPILIFTRGALLGPPEAIATSVLLLVMGIAGYFSWRFIERPFRRPLERAQARRLYAGSAAIAAMLSALGFVAWAKNGMPERFPAHLRELALGSEDTNPRRGECDKPSRVRIDEGQVCHLGEPGARPTVAFIGDSFADGLTPALEEAARRAGGSVAIYTRSGCYPLWVEQDEKTRNECGDLIEATVRAVAADPHIHTVVLFGSWTVTFAGWRYSLNRQPIGFIQDKYTQVPGREDALRVVERSFIRMIKGLGDKRIVIVAHWPEQKVFVPQAVVTRAILGLSPILGVSQTELRLREDEVRQLLARLASEVNLTVLDLSAVQCQSGYCPVIRDGHALYPDYNHPSRQGALDLAPLFSPLF